MVNFGSWLRGRRLVALGALVGLAAVLCTLAVERAAGQTAATVVRVEEDWTLTVNQPDGSVAAPQVSSQMARSPWAARFCNFHINSCDIPQFANGGLQLQVWRGGNNLAVFTSPNGAIMGTANELVTWTQYLDNRSGQLVFGVSAASSTTWGDFSGISVTVPGGSTDLSNYSNSYSVQNSGVTFGANRVASMVLVQTRIYYSDSSVVTDNTPYVVYSATLDSQLSGNN